MRHPNDTRHRHTVANPPTPSKHRQAGRGGGDRHNYRTHQQLLRLCSGKAKCTDCCLRQSWLDCDATSLPIHCLRAGEEGEIDRKVVNKTKKGGSERGGGEKQEEVGIPR